MVRLLNIAIVVVGVLACVKIGFLRSWYPSLNIPMVACVIAIGLWQRYQIVNPFIPYTHLTISDYRA
jgi:hypothetical protein